MDVVVVTMLFGVLGIMIGYKAGLEGGKTAANDRQYWARNGVALLAGVAVSAVVAAADSAKQARDEGMTEEERAKRDLVSVGSTPVSRASSAEKNQKKGR